ncbi:hypothetical protein CORT_0C00560 [Candida orthopsilosis Co 90-125]|uniref:Transcription initiation factor TFIID subunit 12 domain-containing protein n=1 Tax=Candida orthopsilosis (strain 90-125) TaxID=1136231 RepID=H8X3G1_CANO9|nr:hypothetical protein CORT_0C00560 [Candida orthopsilosis Co 90-125]CCG25434.1 hypothetical protein CORT_0C00560 [Candida orthopsilosis Co 90-125]
MEGSSSQNILQNTTPTPEAELNPQRVKVLLNKLHQEFNASKTETDPVKAREHLAKVDKIKRVLKIYHDQQKQRQGVDSGSVSSSVSQSQQISHQSTTPSINTQSTSNVAPVVATPSVPSPLPASLSSSQNQPHIASQDTVRSQSPQVQSPAPQRPNSNTPDAQKITIEKYNQVKSALKDLAEKVQSLTVAKEKETDPVRIQAIEKSLSESRIQLQQYHKGALYMRKVLMDSGRLTANATPVPSPRPPVAIATDGSGASSQSQTSTNERTASPVPSKFINSGQQPSQNKPALPQPTPNATASAVNKKLSSPIPNETKPSPSPTSAKPSTTTKASSTVKAPTSTPQGSSSNTTAKRPQVSTNTTTTSSSNLVNSLRAFGNSPTVPTNIPDNDGRVLTKRKLNELITNLSVDQGDTKPTVDNDVEELFLDLADEFVRSVMGFSCNLAKHRKLDKVDIRDVQLNLERNWGVKVPGYMPDEIKPARRWPKKSDQKK